MLDPHTGDQPLSACGSRRRSLPGRIVFLRFFYLVFFLCLVFCSSVNSAPVVTDTKKIMQLAYRYYTGEGQPVNYVKALRLYLAAAKRGDAEAQFVVGGMYFKGQGTDPDRLKAFKWLRKAEQQGKTSPESLAIIGSMYLQGIGVPQNYLEAKKYLHLAADQGSFSAKKNLAFIYYNGLGEDPDFAKALAVYTEVALRGDNAAQNNVGLMHVNGLGTDVDRVKGYAWYSLAASQGNTSAMIARNNLMIRMSWEELNQAQALSIKLYKQVEKNMETAPVLP
ncbi:MAG: sel1 repeat family protein [Desulfobulbaceae bacterium]|nr:sel1 repeat family protein [Desulfobulbaceae bacterium]